MTPEQEQDIIKMYTNNQSITSINNKYGTCHETIRNVLKKYNIYKQIEKPKEFSTEKVELLYDSGLNGKTIARELGIKYTTFISWCRRNNFDLSKRRKYPERPNDDIKKVVNLNKTKFWKNIDFCGLELRPYAKYYLDENFFEKIDNEQKAYLLGYWYADGNVFKTSCQATSVDMDVLEKAKYCMKFSGKIKTKKSKKNNNLYNTLYIRSSKLTSCLIGMGCVENKSLVLKFPSSDIVPEHLIHHFIRGYFDGDGSIFCGKSKKWDEWAITFVGTKEFMEGIEKHLNIPVRYVKTKSKGNNWVITFCKLEYMKSALEYMYKDATITMNRKAELANQCMQYIYEHQLYKGVA